MTARDPFPGWFAEPAAGGEGPASAAARRAFAPLAGVLAVLGALAALVVPLGGARVAEPDRMADLTARAERLRGLTLTGPIAVERIDRRRLPTLLERLLREEPDPALSPGADDALHLLGVLGPGESLEQIVSRGFTAQVAGLYEPRADRLYLVANRGAEASGGTVLHEIVHAIQDQRFDLDGPRFGPAVKDEDARAAAQALVEGDATEVMVRFVAEQGVAGLLGELGGALSQVQGIPARDLRLPPYLERSLEFPYIRGKAFVEALREEGGQDLVDRAFTDPPATTLAILDPGRYIDGRDRAVPVRMPPPAGSRRVFDATFGAADLLALTGDMDVTLGWRGGRIVVDRTGSHGRLELRVVSRDPAATAEALRDVLAGGSSVRVTGRTVRAVRSAPL